VSDAGNVLWPVAARRLDARAITTAALPLPGPSRSYSTLAVAIDGVPVGTADLADAAALRRNELERVALRYTPVFSGERLPVSRSRRRSGFRDWSVPAASRPVIWTTDYREVTRAEKPGRYGALVRSRRHWVIRLRGASHSTVNRRR